MSENKPVKLTKDGWTLEVRDPSTVTNLRTQGWKPADKKSDKGTAK